MSNYCVILVIIGVISIMCSDISSLSGNLSIIGSNNAILCRDNTDLSQNVVLLAIYNIAQIVYIAQYIQLLIMSTLYILCLHLIQLLGCILFRNLALCMQYYYHVENKPI